MNTKFKILMAILPILWLCGCNSNLTPNTHLQLGGMNNSQANPTSVGSNNQTTSGLSEQFVKGVIHEITDPLKSQIEDLNKKHAKSMTAINTLRNRIEKDKREILMLEYKENDILTSSIHTDKKKIIEVTALNRAVIKYLTFDEAVDQDES